MVIFADMKLIRAEEHRENRLYAFAWMAVFLFLAARIAVECFVRGESAIDFRGILSSWVQVVPFLILFLLHNYIVAPVFVYKKNPGLYTVLTLLMLALFAVWILVFSEGPEPGMVPPEPSGDWDMDGMPPGDGRWGRPMHPNVLRVLIGILLVGGNLGFKVFFHTEKERQDMVRLEKENLKYQLESLRYQINPHFFMNTLNNIHALVDLDPEKAKESIVELSKLMRHVLYDSDKATIPLSQELGFLENYIALMRIRFPEDVDIVFEHPDGDQGAEVPPLVFSSFVENAFKHGMSYEKKSFVHIRVSLDADKIIFRCLNSRSPQRTDAGTDKGVGIANSRQRFDLLYGGNYTLHIDEHPEKYELLLVFPATPNKKV